MTEPTTPLPTEPLLTPARLSLWAQERPLLDPEFADLIIESVSILLRHYGDSSWTAETLPARARDIGYIVAKDYYLNPRQLRQETTGPLQESVDDSTLNGINFTEAQQAELAALAGNAPGQVDGLWSMSFTRGPVEMGQKFRTSNVVIWDTRGAWPIDYLSRDDIDAFGLDEAT